VHWLYAAERLLWGLPLGGATGRHGWPPADDRAGMGPSWGRCAAADMAGTGRALKAANPVENPVFPAGVFAKPGH
jgi:hypothetical protein